MTATESRLDTHGHSRHGGADRDTTTLRCRGTWFDGRTSHRHRVRLRLSPRSLRALPDGAGDIDARPNTGTPRADANAAPRWRLGDLQVGERWDHAPLSVTLPDGGTVWVDDDDADGAAFAKALVERVGAARRKAGRGLPWPSAARVIASWPAVIACLLATIALLVWFDRRGAAMAATTALRFVPTSVDQRIGDAAWAQISQQWLSKTDLSDTRQLRLVQRFKGVAAEMAPGTRVELRFHRMRGGDSPRTSGRGGGGEGTPGDQHDIDEEDDEADADAEVDSRVGSGGGGSGGAGGHRAPSDDRRRRGDGGFNAFAVPNGTIVVLDGLANTLTDDELMAVLGHELGHVVHRHSMKGVMRSAGLLSVASVVLGDFSSVLASSVATLQTLHYSRDDEREADVFGRAFAVAAKLPAGTEASVWRKFQKEEKRAAASGIPAWLSTHPPTEERLKAAEQAR